MNSLLLSMFFLFALINVTDSINCVSCIGWNNAGCNDPYNPDTSGDIPVPGNTYCLKVVYPNYIERMAGGRSCTPGSGAGGSTRYCCSDKDYCNAAIRFPLSFTYLLFLNLIAFVCTIIRFN